MNIALARFPLDSFGVAQLAPVNALADSSPGSVWRLQTEVGDATGIRAFGDARPMVNLSVWESVDALRSFVYDSGHLAVIRRRRTWFSRGAEAHQALWWLPAGSLPSVSDAEGHLEHLRGARGDAVCLQLQTSLPPAGVGSGPRSTTGGILALAIMASSPTSTATTCLHLVGEERFSDVEAEVWIGLLETHKRLTRALNLELEAEHGLSLSALELLGRLSASDHQVLRLTDLADLAGLSLSRVSRIVDALEGRGLVERRRCPEDGRARNVGLTAAGAALLQAAQATHFAGVRESFFAQVEPAELATLAAVFERLAPDSASSCT